MVNDEAESAPANGSSDAPEDVCQRCGATIATNHWYPIAKERTSDGSLELYPFCSEDCKDRWVAERPEG